MDKVKFKKEFIQQYKPIINILKTFLTTEKFYSTEVKYNSYFLPIQLIIQTINVIPIYFK